MVVGVPSTVFAHAGLESSDPPAGAYLDAAPERITLTFDEAITTAFGSLRVLNSSAKVVVETPLTRGADKSIAVAPVDAVLPDGTYVAVWRVMSSDGHPVQGSFTFVVGEATSTSGDAVAKATTVTHGLSRLFVVIRASTYLALALIIGTIVLLWSTDRRRLSPRTSILVRGAWLVLLVATVEGLLSFGPHAAGVKIYKALDGDLVSATLTTTFGRAQLVRVVLLLAMWPLLNQFVMGKRRMVPLAALLVGVVSTVSVSGHALSTSPMVFGVALDVVHLLAIGSWIGGLFVVVFVTRRLDDERTLLLTDRFSGIAQWALPVVIGTGIAQSWLLVKDVTEIFDTQFGRTLVIKVALVFVVIALSGSARRALKQRDARNLRTTVVFEAVVALVVVSLTASLTGLSPKVVSNATPFEQTLVGSEVFVTLAVTPARVGKTEIHLILSRQGGALGEVSNVEMRMGLASMNIPTGPITLTRTAPNHYTADVTFPFSGSWSVEVLAGTEKFSVARFAFDVPISD